LGSRITSELSEWLRPIRNHDVRQERVLLLQFEETFFGPPMRYERGAEVLERFSARDVIVVMMAVDDVFDRLVRNGLDRVDIGLGWTQIGNGIGRDDALRGHDKHRLVIAIAEDIDVFRAVHLFGRSLRRVLSRCGRDANGESREEYDDACCFHLALPFSKQGVACKARPKAPDAQRLIFVRWSGINACRRDCRGSVPHSLPAPSRRNP
jgi:hypothetical protein